MTDEATPSPAAPAAEAQAAPVVPSLDQAKPEPAAPTSAPLPTMSEQDTDLAEGQPPVEEGDEDAPLKAEATKIIPKEDPKPHDSAANPSQRLIEEALALFENDTIPLGDKKSQLAALMKSMSNYTPAARTAGSSAPEESQRVQSRGNWLPHRPVLPPSTGAAGPTSTYDALKRPTR